MKLIERIDALEFFHGLLHIELPPSTILTVYYKTNAGSVHIAIRDLEMHNMHIHVCY